MAKIYETEKCSCCHRLFKPLIPSNKDDIRNIIKGIESFIENPPDNEDTCLNIITPFGIAHQESDITYYLCHACCIQVLTKVLTSWITEERKVLFEKFN